MSYKARIAAAALALALGAAACGDDASDESETTDETTEESVADESTEDTTEDTMEDAAAEDAAAEDAAADDEAMEEDEMAEADAAADAAVGTGTIVDVAAEAGDFTTLLAAAQAAGLVETLSGEGPLTVFAPTDEAFVAALDDLGLTADELLADTETLTNILTYHVVEGQVLSTDLSDGMTATTVNGADLTVSVNGGVMINDATVTTADVMASNGVIHVIDSVLLPPS